MLAIRISAVMALLYGVKIVLMPLLPLYYGLPLHLKFDAGDIIPAVTCIAFLAGGLLAFLWRQSLLLIAVWSWALAMQIWWIADSLIYPRDYSSTIASAGSPAKQAMLRQMFERTAQFELHIQLTYCAVFLIALGLVLFGWLNTRTPQAGMT